MSESLPESSSLETSPPRKKGFSLVGGLGRLFLLGFVGILSTVAGVALGTFLPDRSPQAPFLENALQNLGLTEETRITPKVFNSPDSTNPDSTNINNSPEIPLPSPPPPKASPNNSASNSSPATPTPPTSDEKVQAQRELQQAQQQLKELSDRTASLEQKLGITSSKANLENRLERLTQQLATPAPSPLDSPKATPTTAVQTSLTPLATTSPAIASPQSSPQSSPKILLPLTYGVANKKKITLPPDSLFDRSAGNSSTLRPEAILWLSQVANELRGVAGTTVQVTVHTNLGGEPSSDRRLSFQQAKTIREYLATQLGDRFRFVAIGYGSTRPLFASEGSDRPENRRIEIIVE